MPAASAQSAQSAQLTQSAGRRAAAPVPVRRSGFALITGLLLLVMITLLAVSMLRGNGLQQMIAGNTREKERAFEAAESALQYGEYWLSNGTAGTGGACTGNVTIATTADVSVCATALTAPGDPQSWPATFNFTPPAMMIAATGTSGGKAVDGNANLDINYAKTPGLYIAYLGLAPNGQQMLYSVTGAGYGGTNGTAAVVQSVFATTSSVRNLGNE